MGCMKTHRNLHLLHGQYFRKEMREFERKARERKSYRKWSNECLKFAGVKGVCLDSSSQLYFFQDMNASFPRER